jgi:hypothetical protein
VEKPEKRKTLPMDLTLVNLDTPTETRSFDRGRFELYQVGPMTIGRAAVKMDDGEERVMEPGDLFYVPPGHDSWVVGNEPYISLHVMGSENYAT